MNRRDFLYGVTGGLGAVAFHSMLRAEEASRGPLAPKAPHLPNPRAKRCILLYMAGGPSHIDTFDPKEKLSELHLKKFKRTDKFVSAMGSGKRYFIKSPFKFKKAGKAGIDMCEHWRHLAGVADELTVIKSIVAETSNHTPATFQENSGFRLNGFPVLGAWLSYGLGALNRDLPSYVVLTSRGGAGDAQPLYSRLWDSGFLPSEYSGVKFSNTGDPVYYLSNPPGIDGPLRRDMLDDLAVLNRRRHGVVGDPEIEARIAQYELAFRMQSSVPELSDITGEPDRVLELYGPDVRKPGSFARNCLLARRLAERDVRFIQLFHMGWDQHFKLAQDLPRQCSDTDQPTAGLITDLKRRGLLDDTLIVWGGEFGRTVYAQAPDKKIGRDHHPRCFTTMLAGAGVKKGHVHGRTDDFCYNIVEDPVHVHDLNATILHLLGIDHEKLTFKYQGRQYRLTDVHGELVKGILA